MLRQAMAMKAEQTLMMIQAYRGKADTVNTLQRNMKKAIDDATQDPDEEKKERNWNDNVADLAGSLGMTQVARKARLYSKASRLVKAADNKE